MGNSRHYRSKLILILGTMILLSCSDDKGSTASTTSSDSGGGYEGSGSEESGTYEGYGNSSSNTYSGSGSTEAGGFSGNSSGATGAYSGSGSSTTISSNEIHEIKKCLEAIISCNGNFNLGCVNQMENNCSGLDYENIDYENMDYEVFLDGLSQADRNEIEALLEQLAQSYDDEVVIDETAN